MKTFLIRCVLVVICLPCLLTGGAEIWCRDWDNGTFGGYR